MISRMQSRIAARSRTEIPKPVAQENQGFGEFMTGMKRFREVSHAV
jgi:hypothetical protein